MQTEARRDYSGTRVMKDVETWMANSLATVLAGLAIAAGVIGLLVGLGRLGSTTTPFDDGVLWLAGGIILGLCANVFRREHHVVDNSEIAKRGGYDPEMMRSATYREVDEPRRTYHERERESDRPMGGSYREERDIERRRE